MSLKKGDICLNNYVKELNDLCIVFDSETSCLAAFISLMSIFSFNGKM